MQQTVPQDEIIIDGARLRQAFQRQGRLWLGLGPALVVVSIGLLGALVPRTYTASTSVALQQTSSSSSPLAMLTESGGGASKRYLGLLKSRELASSVERHVQLRQLYGPKVFPKEEDAVAYLMKNVKPDETSADGLLYIGVTLTGPPKFAPHQSPTPEQIEGAAADAANAYARALKEYYATSDTDQGAVLLRGADKQVRDARASYDDAVQRSLEFTHGLNRVDPRSVPVAGSASGAGLRPDSGTDAATAASGLPALYAQRDQVEGELRSAQAVQATGQQLVGKQLGDLSTVPTDDPLLANARSRVTQDKAAYNTASQLYGPENPAVQTAQARLSVDQAELDRQVEGVKRSLTTPDIRTTEQITGLLERQATLNRQITQDEKRLGVSRRLSGESGRLEAEVAIQLGVLNTTLSEAAKIRLDNASSLSRMTVIDAALPPKSPDPGLSKSAVIVALLVFFAFLAAVVTAYFRDAPKKRPAAASVGNGTNGSSLVGTEEKESTAQGAARKQ